MAEIDELLAMLTGGGVPNAPGTPKRRDNRSNPMQQQADMIDDYVGPSSQAPVTPMGGDPTAMLLELILGGPPAGAEMKYRSNANLPSSNAKRMKAKDREDRDPYNSNPNLDRAESEDDPNSYWDGETMGNRDGYSYILGPEINDKTREYPADPVGNGPRVPPIPEAVYGGGEGYDDAVQMLIQQMTGRSPKVPLERGAANETIDQLMNLIGPPANKGRPRQEMNVDQMEAMKDPAFADAYQEWTDANGYEPETDGEFAEVEEWAQQMRDGHGTAR